MYQRTYQSRVLKTDSAKSPKRPFPWKRVSIGAAVVIVLVGFVFLIRAPRFQVKTVNVVGTNVADPLDVSQFVLGTLEGNYLWILPKSSVVLVAPPDIQTAIQAQFPRFKSVKVDRDSMSSLRVEVVEYPGVYLWCDRDDACAFMDEQGTVFADAPLFSGSAYLRIYAGERQPYPFTPVTPEQLATVHTIDQRLRATDIDPISFSFVSSHELRVYVFHGTQRVPILFDPSDDINRALNTLYTGLRTQPLARLYHDRTQVLQYLDLRFASKIVYKFQ
mgnify:CR=1 FL=1